MFIFVKKLIYIITWKVHLSINLNITLGEWIFGLNMVYLKFINSKNTTHIKLVLQYETQLEESDDDIFHASLEEIPFHATWMCYHGQL